MLLLPQPGGTFELKCYQGAGEIQPAHESVNSRAMPFPNQYWTQSWLDTYLALHDELKVLDQFGLPISGAAGWAIGSQLGSPLQWIGFDFAAGQPPDKERFRELVVDGTEIPPSAVTVSSYRQSMTWRMRLPSGNFDNIQGHVPLGPTTAKYANVIGKTSVSCSSTGERDTCDSAPCNCRLIGGVWECAGANGCAGHSVLRYMVTPLKPIESENTVEEIAAYNHWLSTAVRRAVERLFPSVLCHLYFRLAFSVDFSC